MLIYDLGALLLIGIGHIYFFQLLLGNTKISLGFVGLIGLLFVTFLSISLSLTGLSELNLIVLSLLLIVLGVVERKYRLGQIIYFTLLNIVLFTMVKNGLFTIVYALYMESSLKYYVWTPGMLHFGTITFMVLGLFISRNRIKATGSYLLQSKVYWPTFIVLIACTVMLLIVNYPKITILAQLNATYGEQLYMIVLLIALILMTIIAITTYVSKKRLMEQHEQSKQEQLMTYIEKLEFLHDELTTFRHDYSNLLLSLDQSISSNNLEQVKLIYEQTISPTATIINHQQLELTKLSRVEQAELKSILSMKVLEAQRQGLTIHLDIPEPITYSLLPMDELVRIISVLLDNGLEEAGKSNEKFVQVALFQVEQKQYFVVQNSLNTKLNVKAIYQKSFSTKGEGRGVGLFSLQRIIERYPYVTLTTKVSGSMFIQELLIKPIMKK